MAPFPKKYKDWTNQSFWTEKILNNQVFKHKIPKSVQTDKISQVPVLHNLNFLDMNVPFLGFHNFPTHPTPPLR